MNKKLLALLLCVLMATSVVMTACTPNETPGTQKPAPSGSSSVNLPAAPKDVTVSLTLTNQYGKSIADAQLSFIAMGGESNQTVTTDANGAASVILAEGEYRIDYLVMPENVMGDVFSLTVTDGMHPVALTATDNTPNGTLERPFHITMESEFKTFGASEELYFAIRPGNGTNIEVRNANVEVICPDIDGNEITYKPDDDGVVRFRAMTDVPRGLVNFLVINKSQEAQEVEVIAIADPGSFENPIMVESLADAITAKVPMEGVSHYKWIATEAGNLILSSEDTNASLSMYNTTNYQSTGMTDGAGSVQLDNVQIGDEIIIYVGVINFNGAEEVEITFTLSVEPVVAE